MSRQTVSAAALAAVLGAVMLAPSQAQAQSYDRLVVFGDSLSDNGNLFGFTGGTQPPAAFYWQGRFSNGRVFTELLGFDATGFGTTAGSVNYAFGGARTDAAMSPPGMQVQLQAYLANGGTFGSGDLVSVLGGANNIFQALGMISTVPMADPLGYLTLESIDAANEITGLVNAIAGAGAGTVLVSNLPSLAATPQFRGGPAQNLSGGATSTFNAALRQGLFTAAAANANSNIILMDLETASAFFAANPGLFGVTNATDACFNQTTFTVCANPDSYFYFDGVHPTATGHRALANLALDYMYYGDAGAQTTVLGETAFRHRERAMEDGSARLSGREGWVEGSGGVTAGVVYDQTEFDARGAVASAETETWGARFQLEAAPSSSWRFGLGVGFDQGDLTAGRLAADIETVSGDLWAGWRSGNVFVNGVVGVSSDRFDDITRLTALTPVVHTGKTRAVTTGARLQAGTWMEMGGLALSPRAALAWVSADLDGYVEQGPAARHDIADRTVEGVTAEVALRLEGGGPAFGFYAEGGYRDLINDDADPVTVGLAANPAQALSTAFDNPLSQQAMVNLGITARLGERMNLDIGYRGRFAEAADSHVGAITLSLPF
ncbi:autotransporter domain-containing protein [Brevundimonas sp. BAL450]|jgi:outer membrane lipase/esterase|uniref:autotransporter domain-containing protein n=1 Tax=Brevundimonas sp. BAL450 TaxID=1708162 RepID=UPI0018CAADBE|nr:autotransporter domain-containing protein [Brevundimonas sp. BAL450]MBG7615250.1 autotransporter domain-containing protein [Brevundimonas sp. BAL450]